MSPFKEPNYFVPGYAYESWDDYLTLFRGARNEKAIGASSTGYLYCEQSPGWIKSTLDPVKIILILRNPARRAESLYWWMVREGYEDAPTFGEAINRESSRARDPHFWQHCSQFLPDYLYYTTGLYSQQVERFLEIFGRDNVRIYLFEDFIADPRRICGDVFRFLGVDPNFQPEIAVHNEARIPAIPRLQFWLRTRAPRYLRFLPAKMRRELIARLMEANTRSGSTPARDLELEQRLLESYRTDIGKLEQLIERDLSLWLNEHLVAAPDSAYVSVR